MALTAGGRLGPYEIVSALGAGGMGEVYRARDGTLHRDVALKVLPELFALDPDRLARFRREAQVLASLNHPNIGAIYGFEESTSVHALVLELVEGPTLADRIARGPIPLDEALPIARQIAEALEAAHERGVIHRDLKPANIKLRPDGTVKVLDFGLAKLTEPDTTLDAPAMKQERPSLSPTVTSPATMTGLGVILGTAAYMSPQQAKGHPADKRSDVWAFGCVLFEMLTGERTFQGEDVADTLAAVLRSEPDWTRLPAEVPPQIRMLIQLCLAKDRRQRIADMSVALFVINPPASLGAVAGADIRTPTVTRYSFWRRFVLPIAASILVGAAIATGVWLATRPAAPRVTRFAISEAGAAALSVDQVSNDLAITRDGTHIVYKGVGTNGSELFVRALAQLEPTPLKGLGLPRAPFLSPNGQWVGFVELSRGPELKKVALTGGSPLDICVLDGASFGVTWGDDDSIIFATAVPSTGLQQVSADGGNPAVLTKPNHEHGEADHVWPQFLPGSRAVLFTITPTSGGIDASQIAVLDLRTRTYKILVRGGSQAQYIRSGHLVYAAAGTLRAVAFDLERLEPTGPPVPVLSEVVTLPTGTAEFDISADGTLAYVSGSAGVTFSRTLVWVDRQGREEALSGAPPRAYVSPRLSPDGGRVALSIADQDRDVWVWDLAREMLTRLTFDPGLDTSPAWTPDGRRLLYSSQAGGAAGALFWRAADGTGTAERLTEGSTVQRPSAVTPDGTRAVFWEGGGTTGTDVMMVALDGDHRVQPLRQTSFGERNGVISPNGRWLAYESNESGQFQIFVRPFPDVNTGGLWQVSSGVQPLWAQNGRELFYVAPDGALMSVGVDDAGAAFRASTPTKVNEGPYFRGAGNVGRTYDVSLDGRRFLMIKQSGASPTAQASIVVVQNWLEDLKRLMRTN